MISKLNPYPKQPGFSRRVGHAKRALKKLARHPHQRSVINCRDFDNCFEVGDGDAVVWALMHAAETDAGLSHGIFYLDGGCGYLLKQWRRVYLFPISLQAEFGLKAKPPVDLVSSAQ